MSERDFPLLGGVGFIPWSVAARAYEGYARRYGSSQSLERLAERGGFDVEEMDEFLPGWREEVSEIAKLRSFLSESQAEVERLKAAYEAIDHTRLRAELSESREREGAMREAVGQVLGAQHQLKAVVRFFHLWAEDPVFVDPAQRKGECERLEAAILEWHQRLCAALSPEAGISSFRSQVIEECIRAGNALVAAAAKGADPDAHHALLDYQHTLRSLAKEKKT